MQRSYRLCRSHNFTPALPCLVLTPLPAEAKNDEGNSESPVAAACASAGKERQTGCDGGQGSQIQSGWHLEAGVSLEQKGLTNGPRKDQNT